MKLLDYENPLMQILTKMGNLIWLNLLTVACCLPVVTAGAAFAALDTLVLRIVRQKDSAVTGAYFRAFRENFRQGTLVWLILLAGYGLVALDFFLVGKMEIPVIRPLLAVVLGVLVCISLYAFPILARFSNRVSAVIKNALFMSLAQFPKTAVMAVCYAVPAGLVWLLEGLLPLWLLFGLSVPAWISAKLYNRLFLRLEQRADAPAERDDNPPTHQP